MSPMGTTKQNQCCRAAVPSGGPRQARPEANPRRQPGEGFRRPNATNAWGNLGSRNIQRRKPVARPASTV